MVELNKLTDRKLNIITAVILTAIVSGVIAVCFLPGDVVVISNGESYSAIYNGDRNGNTVAMMFNVYEGTEIVDGILNVLEEKNAKATFFVGGVWADDNIDTIKKILEKGHEIGSHGYFHKDHAKLNEEQNRVEMETLHALIKANTGEEIKLFAPPSGSFSATTLKVAEKMGYKTIMWSKDTIDWRDKSAKTVFSRATKNISGGDFVLMHPKKHTLEALPQIIDYYYKAGLKTGTVSECISSETPV